MARIDFGGTVEEVVTRGEFPLEKAREVLKESGLSDEEVAAAAADRGVPIRVGVNRGSLHRRYDELVQRDAAGAPEDAELFPPATASQPATEEPPAEARPRRARPGTSRVAPARAAGPRRR